MKRKETKGYTNWKKAIEKFEDYHKTAVSFDVIVC